jgi:hypothetical protein
VQAAPLSELRQELCVRVKDVYKIGGVKRNFGGVEHFIRGAREIWGGGVNPPPIKSAHDNATPADPHKYFSVSLHSLSTAPFCGVKHILTQVTPLVVRPFSIAGICVRIREAWTKT